LLFIELFAKGNIVLCKKDLTIIVPLRQHKFKDRLVKAGVKYDYPKKEVNFFEISEKDIKKYKKAQEQTISKLLAVELGFGGKYSKEICRLSSIPMNAKSIDEEQANALFKSIKSITARKTEPFVVYTDKGADAVPFELEVYKDFKKERKESFSSAFESAAMHGEARKATRSQKEAERIEKLIRIQEEKIKELEKSAAENQKKGEVIYEKYNLLKEILEEIKKARKKYSWKEIKGKLKGHNLIKEVNEKTGEVVLEV
jgi:predicted ribosome quality control (RQC) complex YloA/Tae2 family protein